MTTNARKADYFRWLIDIVNGNIGDTTYILLLSKLHSIEFYSILPNDDNRVVDGQKLRDVYADSLEEEYMIPSLEGPCTLLEMLIGVAKRIEDMMQDSETIIDRDISGWFWLLIENLKLDNYSDDTYHNVLNLNAIDKICDALLTRSYKKNGNGGLFPLKNSKKDQRKVEIWYQMSAYLMENYYHDDVLM